MKKYENFCAALSNMKEIYHYTEPYDNVVLTGLVGLYEICFEQSWKMMKEILEMHGYEEGATGSPKIILKTAYKAGMIKDEHVWLEALQARNNVTHSYNQKIALGIVSDAKEEFYQMFCDLKKEIEEKIQTSETFLLSAILALSGGFQDAYTYNVRDKVFSNAQTGNVVLMSQHMMMGEWGTAIHYLFPVIAFALGVLMAEKIGHKYKKARKIHWRQIIVAIEFVILFVVGFIPSDYNMLATMLVSFACSMQVQAFRKVHGYGYASTMCIGNLRSGTESLSVYLRDRKSEALKKVAHYYGIILIFAIGAGIGGICSLHIGMKAIWGSSALLILACMMMVQEKR